jgi:arylsulfatase A-like enzyme
MGMTRRALLASSAAIASMGGVAAEAQSQTKSKPNIVVILADDQGYSDWGCFGSEIPTPNIDALAAGGLKFTTFYNTPKCSPSRASLLTGTYPHQAGLGHLEQYAFPESRGIQGKLLDRVATFAELLKGSGYFTAMAGKWHLGITRGVGPWDRGFDRSCTSPQGRMYFPDQVTGVPINQEIYLDGKYYPIDSPEVGKGEWYSADLFVEYSIRYIKEARQKGKPFVLYLPFVNAHPNLMAPKEDIDRFRGKYKAGWDALRRARFERQKSLGIFGPEEALSPREPNTYAWDKLTPEEQDHFDNIMATYAADVSRMDKAIGTLIDSLKSMGVLDDTLILLMADNGANAEAGPDGELVAEMLPGPDGKLVAQRLGGPHSTVAEGMEWATMSNTPFRYFKQFTYEGGISTPLIAHWPRGIDPSLKGTFVRELSHLIDVVPTLLELTDTKHPATYNGHELVPLSGRSFAPVFRGQGLGNRPAPLFWEHQGNRAMRTENFKLVQNWDHPWQLYDMSVDRSETKDVAAARPDLAFQLAAQWDSWASKSYVDPWTDKYNSSVFRNGRRQNWGGAQRPRLPDAMDRREKW